MFFHDVPRISNGFPMLFHDFTDDLLIYNSDVRREKTSASAGAGAAACEKKPFAENHGDKKC